MLDEKKVMNDKLLGVSLFGIAAGFVLGIGLTLVAIAIFTISFQIFVRFFREIMSGEQSVIESF